MKSSVAIAILPSKRQPRNVELFGLPKWSPVDELIAPILPFKRVPENFWYSSLDAANGLPKSPAEVIAEHHGGEESALAFHAGRGKGGAPTA